MMTRALVLLVAACSATPSSTTPVAVPVLPDVPFSLLDRDQRMQFMKERVVPTMAPLFRAHDAKRYAAFDCTTCHGAASHSGLDDFAMPNPGLPHLDVPDRGRFPKPAIEWMTTTIRPTMTKLLVDDTFDCLRCHVREVR
jgi:hypothetical protein